MTRQVYEVNEYDLANNGSTLSVKLNGTGPISIQPTVVGLVGTPKYTVEVSNDNEVFVEYHRSAKNVAMDDSIWIAYTEIPWQYLRLTITRAGADAGIVRFKLYIHGYLG